MEHIILMLINLQLINLINQKVIKSLKDAKVYQSNEHNPKRDEKFKKVIEFALMQVVMQAVLLK